MSEQEMLKAQIVAAFANEIYRGKLSIWHSDGCGFADDVENICDCVLMESLDFLRSWQGQ